MLKKLTGLNMSGAELVVSILKGLCLLAVLYGTYFIGMLAINCLTGIWGGAGA